MTDKKQPEALRLAGLLELAPENGVEPQTTEDAAAELRRLHTENTALQQGYAAARLEIESLRAAQPAPQQEAQEPVAWYVTGCGRLLDEDEAKAEARHIGGTARAMPLYTAPQPLPASQGDALDAEQHEMDAKHAAIYRWMLGHVADVLSIFDNWLADEEADTDELHDALAARAAHESKSHDN